MYEKTNERSEGELHFHVVSIVLSPCEALDDRIDEFAALVKEQYKIPELGDPSIGTEVGRFSTAHPLPLTRILGGGRRGWPNSYGRRHIFRGTCEAQ